VANHSQLGGGAGHFATFNNCLLTGNSASEGGALYYGTANNCTITGNRARSAGGALNAVLNNCILYFNSADGGPNHEGSVLSYCCTTPLPATGVGNIDLDPKLATVLCLSPGSPCRRAGKGTFSTGTDLDGETWASPPSMGCDEYYPGAVRGPLTVTIVSSLTNASVGFPISLTAVIGGRAVSSIWDFGDGTKQTNAPYARHVWETPGDYTVILRAFNDDHPEGVSASISVEIVAPPMHYVDAHSGNPIPPYASWITAASTIQDAVDVATTAGAIVLVTNGVYATGGRVVHGVLTNRVAVDKPVVVQSVNGSEFTVIDAGQFGRSRCVYLTNGAKLSGFSLINGATRDDGDPYYDRGGGGVFCESKDVLISDCAILTNSAFWGGGVVGGVLSNCVLIQNKARSGGGGANGSTLHHCTLKANQALFGGGACASELNNCVLYRNLCSDNGGGAYAGSLANCTLVENAATTPGLGAGGGTWGSALYNCLLYGNAARIGPDYDSATLNYCVATPLPTNGVGNLSIDPLFVDVSNGDLHLSPDSPCINAGNNAYAQGTTDSDGNPRIAGGTVDIGAYEVQDPRSQISYAWLLEFGLATDGSADTLDSDDDGMNNWGEWRCATTPTNAASVLRLVSATSDGTAVSVTWQSVVDRSYFLERAFGLTAKPAFMCIATNLPGSKGTTAFSDTNVSGNGPYFYRVGVQ